MSPGFLRCLPSPRPCIRTTTPCLSLHPFLHASWPELPPSGIFRTLLWLRVDTCVVCRLARAISAFYFAGCPLAHPPLRARIPPLAAPEMPLRRPPPHRHNEGVHQLLLGPLCLILLMLFH